MNRSEWMANRYKDHSEDTYDWVPEIMTTIDPAPAYHNPGRVKMGGLRENLRKRAREGLDNFRNPSINLAVRREKSKLGRLMAHVKHIEMRNNIKEVRTLEGTLPEEAHETAGGENEKVIEILKSEKKSKFPPIKVEPEFNLPYGFGFDHIIKEKIDSINEQKFKNNQIMDELVEKLGYLDYRDALAANKYILETHRHGDIHQKARAKTLALAFNRMSRLKRE